VLFLAGLEIELDKLRGALLRVSAAGFVLSFAIAVAVACSSGGRARCYGCCAVCGGRSSPRLR
jgi:Kef-type K+ transport system membrane component KefB